MKHRLWILYFAVLLGAYPAMGQSSSPKKSYTEHTAPPPLTVIEEGKDYVTQLLGPDVGSSCTVIGLPGTAYRYGGSGPIEITSWELAVAFRPRLSWDTECRFILLASNGAFNVMGNWGPNTGYRGQIPDCAHYPELCKIQIDKSAAIEIAMANGIFPDHCEFKIELTLYTEPSIVWKVESRPENGALSRTLIIDAVTGKIVRAFTGNPCR